MAVWLGPMLGAVPINLTANFVDDALDVNIGINMAALQQTIQVHFFGAAPTAARGDLNGDGAINTTDISTLVQMVLDGK